MNLKITFKSGEQGVNRREFELQAFHMDLAPDTIAPLLIHLTDLLTSQHPGDICEIIPAHVPELAQAEVTKRGEQR
jgi:hypothetical protein